MHALRPHRRQPAAPERGPRLALVVSQPAAARRHFVVGELDARGEIDAHAAMCLRNGVRGALACGATHLIVDLRDLAEIDDAGVALLAQLRAECNTAGAEIELLAPSYVFCW